MQLFSQFRPEVEELKAAPIPWSDKVQRYSEKYGFTLYPAQQREVVKLLERDSALLAAEVGSGKTLLATIFLALRTRRSDTTVIIAPKGVHPQWQEEVARFSRRRVTIVENPASLAPGINLINIEAFRENSSFNCPVSCVIADECHFLANLSAQSEGFLRATTGVGLRLGLSATPIPNRIEELFYTLGWLSHPSWMKGSQSEAFPFNNGELVRFNTEYSLASNSAMVVGVASPERLTKLLEPFLVTLTKSECRSDLPPLKLRFVPCSTPTSVMQSWEKCFKPGNPSNLEMDFLTASPRCSGKVSKLWVRLSQLVRDGQQVLVVSVRQEPLTQLSELLDKDKVSHGLISGSSTEAYSDSAENFRHGDSRVLLMGLKCAQSYNFPQCSHVLIVGSDFTYGMFHQALGRCHRLTSERPVYVEVFYYRGTNEAIALETVMSKAAQATVVLGERDYELDPRIPNDPVIVEEEGVRSGTLMSGQIHSTLLDNMTASEAQYRTNMNAILYDGHQNSARQQEMTSIISNYINNAAYRATVPW